MTVRSDVEPRPTSADVADAEAFDVRWDAWQAKARARTVKTRTRARLALAALVVAIGAVSLWMTNGV
jgi:hypothetical protein